MQSFVPGRSLPSDVVIDYGLLATLNSPRAGGEDEPIAACTVRLVRRAPLCEEHPLTAWHFPPSEHSLVMPIEETGDSTDELYAGRFLLLPHRDLTLALVDARGGQRPFVQLRLAPGVDREGEIAAWRVLVVWSDGGEIALQRCCSSPFIASVRALQLTDAQCCAFVCLGGMLQADERTGHGSTSRLATTRNLTCVVDAAGRVGFALHTRVVPREGEPVSSCTLSRSFRVAVERGDIVLSECWLLLPVICQGCREPVVGEIAYVETLWGKMHPGCAQASSRPVVDGDLAAREPGCERASTNPYQLALPGMR